MSALAALVQSEISDGLGEKGRALALFAQVHADQQVERLVLHLDDQRGRALFESLCDREQLLAVDRLLAEHPALDEAERLAHAGAYVAELLRGRAQADRQALLEEALRASPPGSNTAFELQLALALQGLSAGTQGEVEKRVLALFDSTPGFERRHSIAHETVARAKATDSETLWYDVAEKWAIASEKERPGHKRSEALYRTVALERAYVEWAEGKLDAAREHFDAVTRHSSSLEAYADGIDLSLQAGARNDELAAAIRQRFASTPDEPELAFALAHLEARKLGAESDPQAVSRQADEAKGRLKSALRALPNSVPIHYLWAYLRHQEYLRTGDENTALRANAHYLIVVDLARDDPRYRAAALSGLGFLHAGLQNHSMAASFFAQREKLPFASPVSALAVCLWHADSLLHASHESEAAALADHCVALVDGAPSLARFLPAALDRAALFHNDAGEPELALAGYQRLEALLAATPAADPAARRNQFVVALGLASAKLATGRPRDALADLNQAERIFQQPGGLSLLESPSGRTSSSSPFSPAVMKDDQEALLTGLRARALTELGDVPAAEVQTRRRLALLEARAARDGSDASGTDDRKLLALAHADLAAARYQAGDVPGAIAQVEAGLRDADELAVRSATPIHAVALTLLREYAELHFLGHAPLSQLQLDLPGRLGRAYGELMDRPQPRWISMRERYRLYIERLMLEGTAVALP